MRGAQDRARSATIESRALGALKLASEARDENVPAKRADFLIKNWTFIVKERNLMFYPKYCPWNCSSCVWHKSWSNNASNSASPYTFGLPLRSLSSMWNSLFLNFWNHSRQVLSLDAASPYLSTSNRCASAADFFKLKK